MSPAAARLRPLKQRVLALATVVALLFILLDVLAPTARADTFTLEIPLVLAHGEPGSELVIYDGPLPVSGGECKIIVSRASNNNSVHPGNDLRLETNGQVVNFYDVERAPDAETEGDASIVPGDTARSIRWCASIPLPARGRFSLPMTWSRARLACARRMGASYSRSWKRSPRSRDSSMLTAGARATCSSGTTAAPCIA